MKALRATQEPHDTGRPSRPRRDRRAGCAAAALVALALLVAGCGGSPSSGVANLGGATASKTTPAASGSGGHEAQPGSQAVAYSACMRAHGVKDFPDPTNGGLQIQVHPGSDLSPVSLRAPTGLPPSSRSVPLRRT